jgi:hypothetical protein
MSDERRSHPRRQLVTSGSNPLIATLGVLPRAALVCDISPQGLGLLTTFAPPVGAILPVWLPGPPGQPSGLILATVVHVQEPASDGLYRVGIACHDESGRSMLRDLIARLEGERTP